MNKKQKLVSFMLGFVLAYKGWSLLKHAIYVVLIVGAFCLGYHWHHL